MGSTKIEKQKIIFGSTKIWDDFILFHGIVLLVTQPRLMYVTQSCTRDSSELDVTHVAKWLVSRDSCVT